MKTISITRDYYYENEESSFPPFKKSSQGTSVKVLILLFLNFGDEF